MRQSHKRTKTKQKDSILPNERACGAGVRRRRAAVAVGVQADHVLGVQVDAFDHVLPARKRGQFGGRAEAGHKDAQSRLPAASLVRHCRVWADRSVQHRNERSNRNWALTMTTRRARLRGVYDMRQRDTPESPLSIIEFGQPKPTSTTIWRTNSLAHPHGIRTMSAKMSDPISTGSADSMRTDLRFSPGPSFDLLSTRCGPEGMTSVP